MSPGSSNPEGTDDRNARGFKRLYRKREKQSKQPPEFTEMESKARELLSSQDSTATSVKEFAMSLLTGLRESADALGPLKGAAGCAVFIAEYIDTFTSNKEKWRALGVYIISLISGISKELPYSESEPHLLNTELGELETTLKDVQGKVAQLSLRGKFARFAQARGDPGRILEFYQEIARVLQRFQVQALARIAGEYRATNRDIDRPQSVTVGTSKADGSSAAGFGSAAINVELSGDEEEPTSIPLPKPPTNQHIIVGESYAKNGSAAGAFTVSYTFKRTSKPAAANTSGDEGDKMRIASKDL